MCRRFPSLRVVGLEPQDAPLVEARRNVAAAGLSDRIELRRQGVEEMTDSEAFDLAFFPQSFMSDEVARRGLRAVWKALRPGGWLWIARMSTAEAGLDPAVTRLRDTLWGGYARLPEEIVEVVSEAGFEAVRIVEAPLVVGRRPI